MAWMIASDENLEHLQHYGTPGMKWGVRNYINEDGTLTAAGRERYRNSSGKYVQSKGLQRRKSEITSLRNTISGLDGKNQKAERKKARDLLKEKLASYRSDSKAERSNYTAQQKAERQALKEEKEGLKAINQYTQYNKGMARSIERMNKFTELIGRYRGQSASQIKARKDQLAAKAQEHKNENERVGNSDIREATSKNNVARFKAAMKNYGKRKGGSYNKRSSTSYKNSYIKKHAASK